MNILYILKHDPWGIGGGCYASRIYFELFCELFKNAQFDVLYCEEFKQIGTHSDEYHNFVPVKRLSMFNRMLAPLTHRMSRFNSVIAEVLKQKKYEYCIFDHSSIAGEAVNVCDLFGVKTIVLNHNCELEYYRDSYPEWYKQLLLMPIVKENEKKSFLRCSYNLFLTEEDVCTFKKVYGESPTHCIVGGCFCPKDYQHANDVSLGRFGSCDTGLKIVISGTLGNFQNMDGIINFVNEVLPSLPSYYTIVITGKNPPKGLVEYIKGNSTGMLSLDYNDIRNSFSGSESVSVTNGRVSLISNPVDITEIIKDCDIFLCPTRMGGGVKIRIMDGLILGLPVLAHDVSIRGYSSFKSKGYAHSYSDAIDFVVQLSKIKSLIYNGNISKNEIASFSMKQFEFRNVLDKFRGVIR